MRAVSSVAAWVAAPPTCCHGREFCCSGCVSFLVPFFWFAAHVFVLLGVSGSLGLRLRRGYFFVMVVVPSEQAGEMVG